MGRGNKLELFLKFLKFEFLIRVDGLGSDLWFVVVFTLVLGLGSVLQRYFLNLEILAMNKA